MQNNFDPIDPAKVVMDNEPIDPAKVVMDNDSIYPATAADIRRVRMAFVGDDPLGFIAHPDARFYMQQVTETLPDRDEYRKRMALAAYFTAHNKGADYRFVLGNLDGILEQFYKKKTSVDAAYADIAQMYAPPRTTTAAEFGKIVKEGAVGHVAALGAGAADFASRMAATYLKLGAWGTGIAGKVLSPVLTEDQKKVYETASKLAKEVGQKWVIKGNQEIAQGLDETSGANPDFLTDMILGDFDKVSPADFTKALIRSFPDMAFQLGLAVAAPYAVPAVVGTQTAAMKDYEVDEKQPDWGGVKRLSYIGFHAVSEALLETVTAKIAGGQLTREAAAEILAKGLWKYLGASYGKEAGTEAFQQLSANALDLLYNIDGDRQKLSGSQIMGKLFQGVPESGFVGGVYGLPFGYTGFRNTRQMMGAVESTRQKHQEKVRVLASKETLSETEKVQLQVSQEILENNSPQEILGLDHVANKMAEANSEEEIRNSEEFQELLSSSAPGVSEEQISAAVRAQRNLAFKDTADYDLNDVYDKVNEIAADFPSVEFVTVDNWGQLPDDLRSIAGNRGRGFFNPADGKVYINASRVRPHEVLELMLHEAVGHKGLRAVVPQAQLEQMLDKVYAAHFNDEEFQKIASRYFPEAIQSLTDENGEEYFGVSLEDAAQQREAAEEYIAHIAQKGVPKPSWWKQFLQQIRMFFGKFKWAEDAVLLDSQIETVLALAAKRVRKAGVKEYLTTGTGLRFSETDDYGQVRTGTDMSDGSDELRFSLEEYSESEQEDIVAVLQVFVGRNIDMEPEKYREYLRSKGIQIPDQDADVFFRMAVLENDRAARERANRLRDQWIYENFPIFAEVAEFAGGSDFKIKPVGHEGEEFTGSYISPEYVKYSIKAGQGKRSDKQYRKYLADRKERLENAAGFAIDEVAEAVARKLDQDPDEVKAQILDFFRHLKKKDLISQYSQFKKDSLALDKEAEKQAREEFMQQEKFRIEDEAIRIMTAGESVTPEWIADNPKVFKEVYKRIFNGKEAPSTPSNIDVEAVNAALTQEGSTESFGPGYKEGKRAAEAEFREKLKAAREKAYEEFTQKLLQIKAKVMQSKTDVLRLQREAAEFAEQNLPPERRSLFIRGIIGLLEHSNVPSGKYPEGRREFEFRKLIADMTQEAADTRKKTALADIREMLDNYKVSRTFKGIPVSKAPSVQGQVTEISRITRMTAGALNTYFGLQSQTMAQTEEGTPVWEDARTKAELAAMFGNLEVKSADEITRAKEHLEDLILRGKADIKARMRERLQSIRAMRSKVIDNLSGGVVDTTGKDAQKFNTFLLKNRTLDSLLMISANKALRDFENTPQAEFIKEYTYAQEREKTRLRHLDQDFRQAVKDIFGFDGIMGWKKFLDEVNAPVQGVVRSVYTAKIEEGKNNYFLVGKRPAVRNQINWRIAEYAMDKYGDEISQVFKRPDIRHARELLKEYGTIADDYAVFGLGDRDRFMVFSLDSSTGQVTEFEVPSRALDRRIFTAWNIQDIGKRFVRKQLEDVSAGVVPVKSEFSSEAEDAQYQIINENDKTDLSVEFIADPPELKSAAEEIPDLTINKALQLILEWEQSDYKDAFEWNGFSQKTMDQLYQAVGDKYLRLAYWMRDYIQKDSEALDKVSREKYGVPLPRILNYWMGAFQGVSRQKTADNGLGRNLGAMSMNPSFLIARKGHLKAPDINAEAISMFLDHVQKQVHFVENNDVVFKLRSVFNDMKVKQAMNSTLGKNVTDDILRRITEYAQGGGMEGKGYISDLFNRFTKYYAPAKIGFSLPSMIKQIAGSAAYAYEIPLKEYLKYSGRTYKLDGDFKKFARFAWKSDFVQNRFSGGLDKDLVYMMNHSLNSEKFSVFSSFLLDTGSLPLRWGDVVAVIKGGYPVYAYTRDQALANGATPEEAHHAGEFAWMKATNETQQSSNITSQNYFMSNPTAGRILTLFRSNAIQTLDLVLRSIDEVKLGGMTQATKNKLARQLLISHVVIPANMFLVSQIWANGLDVEEWDWEELVVGMLWGSWEGIIFAEFVKKGTDMIAKRLAGKGYFSRPSSIVPTLDNAGNLMSSFSRLTGDKELAPSDVAGAIQSLGDALMVGGAAYAPAGEFGAVISALGMRSKQVLKWFENKK